MPEEPRGLIIVTVEPAAEATKAAAGRRSVFGGEVPEARSSSVSRVQSIAPALAGSATYRWDNKSMYCIVTVFGLAI